MGGDWSNCLGTVVPSFFRCFWCSGYFDVAKEFISAEGHNGSRCCLSCATNLSNKAVPATGTPKWQHCPICHKFIPIQPEYSPLAIHVQHRREEQQKSLKHRCKNTAHAKCYYNFSLASWYPNSIDSERLFWNQHRIT